MGYVKTEGVTGQPTDGLFEKGDAVTKGERTGTLQFLGTQSRGGPHGSFRQVR